MVLADNVSISDLFGEFFLEGANLREETREFLLRLRLKIGHRHPEREMRITVAFYCNVHFNRTFTETWRMIGHAESGDPESLTVVIGCVFYRADNVALIQSAVQIYDVREAKKSQV